MLIRPANQTDIAVLLEHDNWVSKKVIAKKVDSGQVYVVFDSDTFVGWLRYGLFWDNTPYMNMLYLIEEYRGKGIGRALVAYWEKEMKTIGYKCVLTSSAQTEYAQHFYRKLGYRAIGSFTLDHEPLEIIFEKQI